MLAVTIDHLPGYEIKEILGAVLGSTARPQNVFAEGIQEQSGRRGQRTSQLLRQGRAEAIARMREDALARGANAVLGLRFDHRSVGPMWMEICAYGTAVFVQPAPP